MRKRILSLIVAFFLLLPCMSAGAEDVDSLIDNALYRIVLRTAEGDVLLGSGVLFLNESVLLTAEGCCREGQLYAIGGDGEHAIQAMEKAGSSGAVLMEMAKPSNAQPLTFSDFSAGTLPWIFGMTQQGDVGLLPLYHVRHAVVRGQNALVIVSEEGLLPGAVAVDEKGQVVALTVSQQGEGIGMYAALDADNIYTAMFPGENSPFVKTELSWRGGSLTVSWTDRQRKNGMYVLTLSGDDNSYYTTFEADQETRSMQFAVPAGHSYDVQVQWVAAGETALEPDWRYMQTLAVPELPFRQFGYTQECYFASAPAGTEITDILPDMGSLTLMALADGKDHYLQVISRYDVTEEFEAPMAVELIAPDGQFYFEEHRFVFSPEWEEEDCFALYLDGLLTTCQEFSGGVLKKGEYRVRYAIGGYVAGEYTFTLE